MRRTGSHYNLCPIATLVLLCGCQHRLVFTTQTSIGLDVSGTVNYPNKVSLSYNRYEGAIVPRKTGRGNDAHSVYGALDADMAFGLPPRYSIKQIFATGEAAKLATVPDHEDAPPPEQQADSAPGGVKSEAKPGKTKIKISESSNKPANHQAGEMSAPQVDSLKPYPLVFFTATTFGLHITAGEKELSPNALLGYRRSECSVIPIYDSSREVRSVFADITIRNVATESDAASPGERGTNSVSASVPASRLGGVRMRQSFATGAAAESFVTSQVIRQKLRKAVEGPPDSVSVTLPSGISFQEAVKMLSALEGRTAEFRDCSEGILNAKLNPGAIAASTTKDLLQRLEERMINPPTKRSYKVKDNKNKRTYEIHCSE